MDGTGSDQAGGEKEPSRAAPASLARTRGALVRAQDAAPAPAPSDEAVVEGEVLDAPTPEDAFDAVALPLEEVESVVADEALPYIPLARSSGAVVRRDALSRYLADISRFERLTAAEEHRLAVRFREHGDHEAAARLVTSNLRLVVAVALGFRRAVSNLLDLIQEGNIGLMEAVERFDPGKGARLSTYATWWIRSRIVKYLLDNWRLVRVGTTNARRKLLYNLQREKIRLEAMGIDPTPKILAERLGTTADDVIAVDRALGARDVSLDAPLTEEGQATRGDLLADELQSSPEQQASAAELRGKLHEALAEFRGTLAPRERSLLDERLLADEPCTLQDIADREGVTREAVRQSEARLMSRLRAFLRERLPEAAEISFENP